MKFFPIFGAKDFRMTIIDNFRKGQLKNEIDSKNEDKLKNEDDTKNKDGLNH